MAARFGDMLQQRRRQLGLSIQQVANTIKIRPQIIEFFEMGDFSSMPPRGYAQGMISSYARYLGLNPREVVNAYFDELRAFEEATARTGGRFAEAAGSASPRSAASQTGRFLMVGATPPSRYGQRPPQAGYVSEVNSGHEPQRVGRGYRAARPLPAAGRDAGYAREGYGAQETRVMPAVRGDGPRPYGSRPTSSRALATQGNRQRRPGTAGGRGGVPPRSGSNGRRPPAGRGGNAPRRGTPPRRGSNSGNRAIIVVLIALVVLIVLVLILLVRGCPAPAATDDASGQTATQMGSTQQDTSGDDASDDTDSSDATDGTSTTGTGDAATGTGTDATGTTTGDGTTTGTDGTTATTDGTTTEPQQTIVRISIADGDSSWLEVRLDGEYLFGNEVYGPFEQEYTVTDSLRITANTPNSVTVTQNGEQLRWDTSISGVARINLTAPKTTATTDGTTGDATTGDATTTDPAAASTTTTTGA